MVGKAAMIAVPLAPTASIARHDDHRSDANSVRWFIRLAYFGEDRVVVSGADRPTLK